MAGNIIFSILQVRKLRRDDTSLPNMTEVVSRTVFSPAWCLLWRVSHHPLNTAVLTWSPGLGGAAGGHSSSV